MRATRAETNRCECDAAGERDLIESTRCAPRTDAGSLSANRVDELLEHSREKTLKKLSTLSAALMAVGIATASPAQFTGTMVGLTNFGDLLEIKVPGGATTLLAAPGGGGAATIGVDVIPDAANQGYAILYFVSPRTAAPAFHLLEYRGGMATTLTTVQALVTPFNGINGNLTVDQNGDYILTTGANMYRYSASGGLTTLATRPFGGHTDNTAQGGWFAFDFQTPWAVTRGGVVTSLAPLPVNGGANSIDANPFTGDAYYTAIDVWRYAPGANAFSKLATHPGTIEYTCCEVDPRSRDLIVGAKFENIMQVTANGTFVATLHANLALPLSDFVGTAIEHSRELGGIAAAVAGQTYPLLLSLPAHANDAYILGCSFGFQPGIPTAAGAVPLNPDALFGASQALPQLFTQFQGTLDAQGQAFPTIRLPAGTTGIRFFVAGLVLRNNAIAAITAPFGVTVG